MLAPVSTFLPQSVNICKAPAPATDKEIVLSLSVSEPEHRLLRLALAWRTIEHPVDLFSTRSPLVAAFYWSFIWSAYDLLLTGKRRAKASQAFLPVVDSPKGS
jgi:hypothetical protein